MTNKKLLEPSLCNYHSLALWIQNKSSKKQISTTGIEPGPRRWERRILTTRPRGICAVELRVLVTAQSSGLVLISQWLVCKFAKVSSLHYNSLSLISYFWSDCSVICYQTKAICPPFFSSLRKYRILINLKKKWKRKQMKPWKISVSDRLRYICIVKIRGSKWRYKTYCHSALCRGMRMSFTDQ